MPGWTDLKPEMATSWKVSWNVDPLAFSVPLRTAPLEEAAPPPGEEPLAGADEEHPARARTVAARAAPTVAACCRRRSGMSGTPNGVPGDRADQSSAAAQDRDVVRVPSGRGDH